MKKENRWGIPSGSRIPFKGFFKTMKRNNALNCTIIKSVLTDGRRLEQELIDIVNDVIQDGLPPFSDNTSSLVFSMNKGKRWNLGSKIADTIDEIRENSRTEGTEDVSNNKQQKKNPISVTMANFKMSCENIQKHWYQCLDNHAHCTRYLSSKAECHAKPVGKYSYMHNLKASAEQKPVPNKSLLKKQSRKQGHNRHYRGIQRKNECMVKARQRAVKLQTEAEQNDTNNDVTLHYSVVEPKPYISRRLYFHKDVRNDDRMVGKSYINKNIIYGAEFNNKDLKSLCHDYDNYLSDGQDEELDEVISSDDLDQYIYTRKQESLSAFISTKLNKNTAKSLQKEKRKGKAWKRTCEQEIFESKNKIIVVEKENKDDNTEIDYATQEVIEANTFARLSQFPDDLLLQKVNDSSVHLDLEANSIKPQVLHHLFGYSYAEGNVCPRSFIVNMSTLCTDKQDVSATPFIMPAVFGVFTNLDQPLFRTLSLTNSDGFEEIHHLRRVQYKIHGDFTEQQNRNIHLKLETLFNSYHSLLTVNDVIFSSIQVIRDILEKDAFAIPQCIVSNSQNKYADLADLKDWNISQYELKDVYNVIAMHRETNVKKNETSSDDWVSLQNEEQMCELCLCQFDCNGTLLVHCNHQYCNDCWRMYLYENLMNGNPNIICPAYKCDSPVTEIALLVLMGYKWFSKFWYLKMKSPVHPGLQWTTCPNDKCNMSAVVKMNKTERRNICVKCLCKHQYCFDCKQEPHWPISCKAAEPYLGFVARTKKIKHTEMKFVVKVKRCPRCKEPMEKNGGCQCMSCRCGHRFCWYCLKDYSYGRHAICSVRKEEVVHLVDVKGDFCHKPSLITAMSFRESFKTPLSNDQVLAKYFSILKNKIKKEYKYKRVLQGALFEQYSQDEMNIVRNIFEEMNRYYIQVNLVMEFTTAFLAQLTRRHLNPVKHVLDTLKFRRQVLLKMIHEKQYDDVNDLEEDFCNQKLSCNKLFLRVEKKINIVQEKINLC